MRYVVVGAGAVGGAIAGRLFESGAEVVLVARGDNYSVIHSRGLTLESPGSTSTLPVPVTNDVNSFDFRANDAIVVAVKGQDSLALLRQISAVAPRTVSIICAQNGMENERVALRLFPNVYAMCVLCPSLYLQPGIVQVHSAPVSGVLDLGRWPSGNDEVAAEIAATLEGATFKSEARADIATLKWGKLMSNILNSVEALCGSIGSELAHRTRDEARNVLTAAGIDVTAAEQAIAERFPLLDHRPVDGASRGGGSSWQSLTRGLGDIETDYLNGEIVLLGRLYAVATPVNELLQRYANESARNRRLPGSISEEQLLAMLD